MATLSAIPEESDGHVEIIDDEEVQLVPETQFADTYNDEFNFSDDENDGHARLESVTPGTQRFLDAARPSSSHRPALAMEDMSFVLQRPKSSGEDSLTGFSFAKHEIPKMNFSHERQQQQPPPPKAQKQDEPKNQGQADSPAIRTSIELVPTQQAMIPTPATSSHHHTFSVPLNDTAPVSANVDRQPTKKLPWSKGDRKRSKEKARIPQESVPFAQRQVPDAVQNGTWHEQEQPWKHQNGVEPAAEQMAQHRGLVENLFQAGDSTGDMQPRSPLAQLQEVFFDKQNNQVIIELPPLDNDHSVAQQFSNPSFHHNPTQLVPLALGMKKGGVKKKKRKRKMRPALDISTLPQVIFDVPFEELGKGPAASNHHPEPNQDQVQNLAPQDAVFNSPTYLDDASHISEAAPEFGDQRIHNETIEAMDVDRCEQLQATHHAPTHAVTDAFTQLQTVPRTTGTQSTHRRHNADANKHHREAQHDPLQQAEKASINQTISQEPEFHQGHRHQECEIDEYHQSAQYHASHHPQAENFSVDEHVSQDLHAHQGHQYTGSEIDEHRRELQQRTPPNIHSMRAYVKEHAPQGSHPRQSYDQPIHIEVPEHPPQGYQGQTQPSHLAQKQPRVFDTQSVTRRHGAQSAASRPRRSSRKQIAAHDTHAAPPIAVASTIAAPLTAVTNVSPVTAIDGPLPTQTHTVTDAFDLLRLTLQQDLQATTAKENEARNALQSEVAELKVSEAKLQAEVNTLKASEAEAIEKSKQDREKLKANTDKLTKLHKFTNGINNDLVKERQNAKALHQQIAELVSEGKVNSTERKNVHEHLSQAIETSKTVQNKFVKELTNARLSIQKLELEKIALEKELQEKSQLLEDERDQRLRLAEDFRLQAIDQQLMKQLINDNSSSIIQKLSELQMTTLQSRDTVTSQGVVDLLQMTKDLRTRNHVSSDDLKGLEEQISSFQNNMINRMAELQSASTTELPEIASNAKAAFDLEEKLSEQLIALKADILSTQSLQAQVAELREAKATSDERSGAKDLQIKDLNEQLGRLQEAENILIEKLNQAEAQLCEHTGPSDQEIEGVKQELEEAKRQLETAGESETTLRTELDVLKESIKLKESEINSIAKQKLESERKAIENYSSMRSQLSKEAQRLRQEQAAEFENRLYQANQRNQQLTASLQKSESSTASHVATTESTNKDHVAALDALKQDHAFAIETIRTDFAAALETQARRFQEEARKKSDAQRRDLNDKADREKDELHRRIANADTKKENAFRSLEKAKQEAEEIIKKQVEKTRVDLNDLQSRLKAEAQQEADTLTQSHSKEQDILRQRATKAEAELENLRSTLKAELSKPSQPSQGNFQSNVPSSEPTSAPFKKPRRKVDRREVARPSSRMFSDDGMSVHDATPAASKSQGPRIRTFAEIDSMISESFQIYEDPKTSSELTDLSSLPSDPRALRELTVMNPRVNVQSGTSSGNSAVSNPFFGPARPRSREHALPNTVSRITGSYQTRSSMVGGRVAETQLQSELATAHSMLDDLPSEVEDSQTQPRQSAFRPGKENRPPVNNAPTPGQSAIRSAHFQTPKAKDKRAATSLTESSSSDYLGLSKAQLPHKTTTYGHGRQANPPSPGHVSQPAARNEPLSSAKRRRSTNTIEDMASKKRGKTTREQTREQPVLHFEISESQSQDVDTQRITESSAQRVSETQTQASQTQSRSAIAPASRGRLISVIGASPGVNSQPRPSSSEHVSQSRARASSTRSTTAANRGKGRTTSGRNHATRYDLRFNQELHNR